ncbi:MAG: hypothetical protein JRH19_17460, partial [Deltaproteobacteria bacterium]|nr:hypothetical protein [Deltaproteobacteria bacterium]
DLAKKRGKNPFSGMVEKLVWAAYADYETKAQAVPSAFVNPFGFYMAGMIQEFESADDPSLMYNACISYGKALELNPESKVIREAYEAMQKGEKAGDRRLVQVVAFDGFTPEKKVLEFQIPVSSDMIIPVKLPVYEPVDSVVSGIAVTGNGEPLADLDEVASVEAISLRYQSDQRSKQTLDVLIRVAASVGKRTAAKDNSIAMGVVTMHDALSTPDMRSWMSLPATISAARFYAPPGVDAIEIHSRDETGAVLSTQSVAIAESGPTFIFVRSMDAQMLAHANQSLWFN